MCSAGVWLAQQRRADPDHVSVMFSLLLNDALVLHRFATYICLKYLLDKSDLHVLEDLIFSYYIYSKEKICLKCKIVSQWDEHC